jgi:UDP-N-acetylglucosamine 2-epimerase
MAPANVVAIRLFQVQVERMRHILIATASRAERGLLEPIATELHRRGDVEVQWFEFEYDTDHPSSVIRQLERYLINLHPDIVLVPCDRFEMTYVAAFAFHHGHIVAHFHAGDLGTGISDEINRYVISMFSHILFCNSDESRRNLLALGFEPHRIYVVGSTAMDHVDVDESLIPNEAFDLVLLHPDPTSMKATMEDLVATLAKVGLTSNPVIWLKPNKDPYHEVIEEFLWQVSNSLVKGDTKWHDPLFRKRRLKVYDDLPRAQFLGLLKRCSRAIGNSSAFTYELPFLNPNADVLHIGQRNIQRTPPSGETGGSKRIAEVLATIPIDDALRRKQVIQCQKSS